MQQQPSQRPPARAFSLIELVIVVVILGVVAAIAAPRLSNAAGNASDSAVSGSLAVLTKAADMYSAEHGGVAVGQNADGSTVSDARIIVFRFTLMSDGGGTTGTGTFGPYLRKMPTNPMNGRSDLRIDIRSQAGKNAAGWVYVPAEQAFLSDADAGSGSGGTTPTPTPINSPAN